MVGMDIRESLIAGEAISSVHAVGTKTEVSAPKRTADIEPAQIIRDIFLHNIFHCKKVHIENIRLIVMECLERDPRDYLAGQPDYRCEVGCGIGGLLPAVIVGRKLTRTCGAWLISQMLNFTVINSKAERERAHTRTSLRSCSHAKDSRRKDCKITRRSQ